MRTASAISTGLHAAVLLWALISFSGKSLEATPAESLPVDIISDKDFSEITKGVKDAPKPVDKPKPLAEKIDEPKPKIEDIKTPLNEKKEVKATIEKSEPAPQAKPDPIGEKIAKEQKQTTNEEPKPLPPKKPPLPKQPKFEPEKIAALLDQRAPQREAIAGESLNKDATLGHVNANAARLSVSEMEALRRRITDCWSPPVGLEDAQDLVVVFRVLFNPDGSVKRGPDIIGGKPNAAGPVFAESARRAILQCQPYTMLRKETYNEWKDIEIAFKPADMFR